MKFLSGVFILALVSPAALSAQGPWGRGDVYFPAAQSFVAASVAPSQQSASPATTGIWYIPVVLQDEHHREHGRRRWRRGMNPPDMRGMDRQGMRLPPLLMQRFRDLPPKEQEKILRNNERFQELPKERQERMIQRLHRFQALSPQQREMIWRRFDAFSRLTPEQRRKARSLYTQHWRNLPPDRRHALMRELRKMREMPPQEREKYLSGPGMVSRFSPEERDVLRQLDSLRLGPPPRPPRLEPPPPASGASKAQK